MISMQHIQSYCDAIAAAFKPRKIILFGSYAYGQPTEDSDVDVMVVMPRLHRSRHEIATGIRMTVDCDFPVDFMTDKIQTTDPSPVSLNPFFLSPFCHPPTAPPNQKAKKCSGKKISSQSIQPFFCLPIFLPKPQSHHHEKPPTSAAPNQSLHPSTFIPHPIKGGRATRAHHSAPAL